MRPLPAWLAVLASLAVTTAAAAQTLTFEDPRGDDKGPGTYTYPTSKEYRPGAFDLRKVEIEPKGDDVVFRITIATRIDDPWNSREWQGNGFSLQFVQVYLDRDHKPGSGHTDALPGLNVRFAPESAWDKVVLISPQPRTRLQSEVNAKAAAVKADVVIPRVTRARGKTLEAVVSKADLGGVPGPGWGVQVVMQSNEGFPSGRDLLTRKVNEYAGPHRFGGGSDWDCDPHVIDILAGAARGEAAEAQAQFSALAYQCDPSGDLARSRLATLPMIYR